MDINIFDDDNFRETFSTFPPINDEYLLPMTYYDDESVFSTTARTNQNDGKDQEMPLNFPRIILKDTNGVDIDTDSVSYFFFFFF